MKNELFCQFTKLLHKRISREFGNATRKKQSNFEVEESSFMANVFVITQN